MFAIMWIDPTTGKWNTWCQMHDEEEAKRIALTIDGIVVPWEDRLFLLDNELLANEIVVHYWSV